MTLSYRLILQTLFTSVAPAGIIRVVKAGSVEVIFSATPPPAAAEPNVRLNTLIGVSDRRYSMLPCGSRPGAFG
jgi:hypothetical protein